MDKVQIDHKCCFLCSLYNNQHLPLNLNFLRVKLGLVLPVSGHGSLQSHLLTIFTPALHLHAFHLIQFVCLLAENSSVATWLHLKNSSSSVLPFGKEKKSVSTRFLFPRWNRPATLARSVQQHPVNLISVVRRSLKPVSQLSGFQICVLLANALLIPCRHV